MKVLLSLGPGLVSYFLLCFQAMLGGARSSSPGEVVCHPFSKQHGAVGTHTHTACLFCKSLSNLWLPKKVK